jgi:hypothetical protein
MLADQAGSQKMDELELDHAVKWVAGAMYGGGYLLSAEKSARY